MKKYQNNNGIEKETCDCDDLSQLRLKRNLFSDVTIECGSCKRPCGFMEDAEAYDALVEKLPIRLLDEVVIDLEESR